MGRYSGVVSEKPALIQAAEDGALEEVQRLLQEGADVNDRWSDLNVYVENETALHRAVGYGQITMVRFLLEAGADPALRNGKRETALHQSPGRAITKLLLDHGADPNAVTKDGDTPLHLSRTAEGMRLLIEAGAKLEVANERGQTPLFQAVETPDCVRALLKARADWTVRNNDGYSVLYHWDVHPDSVKLLLAEGLDLNEAHPESGGTALHWHLDITWYDPVQGVTFNPSFLNLLLDLGADPSLCDFEGRNAFDLAEQLYREEDDDMSEEYREEIRHTVLEALRTPRSKPTAETLTVAPPKTRTAVFKDDLLRRLQAELQGKVARDDVVDSATGDFLITEGDVFGANDLESIVEVVDTLESGCGTLWGAVSPAVRLSEAQTENPHTFHAWVRIELEEPPIGSILTPAGLVVQLHSEFLAVFHQKESSDWTWEGELAPGKHQLADERSFTVREAPAGILVDELTGERFRNPSVPAQVFRF